LPTGNTSADFIGRNDVRLADLRGRSVAVWGTGREARAAVAAIAGHEPSRLIAVDDRAGFLDVSWDGEPAPLAGGDHAFPALLTAEVVVRSAEVAPAHPWLGEVRRRGITVTSCSALWLADHAAQAIGVTGSAGTTITARFLSHLLTAAGRPNILAAPLLGRSPAPRPGELHVVALSGRQCGDLTRSPRVAVVTSLLPDASDASDASADEDGDPVDLLRYGPELIVVDGADLLLRDRIRGLTDVNNFPSVPAGAEDSRFRVADGFVFCSDEPLFARPAGARPGRDLCLALAVLDGLGVDVPGLKDELAEAVASFEGLPGVA
jgi:hypothetical protein